MCCFPILKLVSSFLNCNYHSKFGRSKFIYFFTFKSGKWSMADVFVVAIFMAFIGFNGIVSSQLSQLNNVSENVEILTTNGTNLQAGFYLFLLFCIGGLFFGDILQKSIFQVIKINLSFEYFFTFILPFSGTGS